MHSILAKFFRQHHQHAAWWYMIKIKPVAQLDSTNDVLIPPDEAPGKHCHSKLLGITINASPNFSASRWMSSATRNFVDGVSLEWVQQILVLKFLRGIHTSNIRGMRSVQELEGDNIQVVRPLLSLLKQDLYDYVERTRNAGTKYQRSMVRNQLIPLMQYQGNTICNRLIPLMEELAGRADILEKGCRPINNKARKFTRIWHQVV